MNIPIDDLLISLIPATISLLAIPINYFFNSFNDKNMSVATRELYTTMLEKIYLPLYLFIMSNDLNIPKNKEKLILTINNLLTISPLLIDSDTAISIFRYNQTKNEEELSNLISHIKMQYEYLKHKLHYLSNYTFYRLFQTAYCIYGFVGIAMIIFIPKITLNLIVPICLFPILLTFMIKLISRFK